MVKLESGNVVLKPSQKKRLMAWLKRSLRLGQRLGDFVLTITLNRIGRIYHLRATVHDSAGDFHCRSRNPHWRDACRELVRSLSERLHSQYVHRLA